MNTELSALEQHVLSLDVTAPLPLSSNDVASVLANPSYRSSLGTPANAQHFRRSLPDGRGLHLVMAADGAAALHWDRYDPHAGPASALLHLMTDSPREAISLLAAGSAVLQRLG